MSHNPHNNYPGGNKFHHERSQPASEEVFAEVKESIEVCEDCKVEETPVVPEAESCEEVKVEETVHEDVVQDTSSVSEEPEAAPEVVSVVDQPETETFVEEDSEVLAVVTNCRKLNIREAPNMDADIVTVLPAGSEVMVDVKHSIDDFYKVCNAVGIEGYCMKQYIELRG